MGEVREIAGDEGLAEEIAGGGDGGEMLEAISEAGEDLAHLIDKGRGLERQAGASLLDPCLPEALGLQVEEGVFRRVLVVVLADEQETGGETVAQVLAPRDAFRRGLAFIDEIERGQ